MKILAVEFSSEERGVAVLDEHRILSHVRERGGRRAIELVERALSEARCEREEIDVIAIGLGPGSYTGIRGAIALACGWQLGREIKLLGISTVECLAEQARESGMRGTVHIVIDAQRNEYYLAGYEVTDSAVRVTAGLRIVPSSDIQKLCQEGHRVIGPELGGRFPQIQEIYPDATVLARLALGRSSFVDGDKLEPIYLRQAEYKKAPPRRVIT